MKFSSARPPRTPTTPAERRRSGQHRVVAPRHRPPAGGRLGAGARSTWRGTGGRAGDTPCAERMTVRSPGASSMFRWRWSGDRGAAGSWPMPAPRGRAAGPPFRLALSRGPPSYRGPTCAAETPCGRSWSTARSRPAVRHGGRRCASCGTPTPRRPSRAPRASRTRAVRLPLAHCASRFEWTSGGRSRGGAAAGPRWLANSHNTQAPRHPARRGGSVWRGKARQARQGGARQVRTPRASASR